MQYVRTKTENTARGGGDADREQNLSNETYIHKKWQVLQPP